MFPGGSRRDAECELARVTRGREGTDTRSAFMDVRVLATPPLAFDSRSERAHAPLYFSFFDPDHDPRPSEKVSRNATSPVTTGSTKGCVSAACAEEAAAAMATPATRSLLLMLHETKRGG